MAALMLSSRLNAPIILGTASGVRTRIPRVKPRRPSPIRRWRYISFLIQQNNLNIVVLVEAGGFEPPTNWLKANCSKTAELRPEHIVFPLFVVGAEGFEPPTR
tara:strand:- start:1077 stop:1385 length:309 start_codon:yes stop_codon:yes gene_type:complete